MINLTILSRGTHSIVYIIRIRGEDFAISSIIKDLSLLSLSTLLSESVIKCAFLLKVVDIYTLVSFAQLVRDSYYMYNKKKKRLYTLECTRKMAKFICVPSAVASFIRERGISGGITRVARVNSKTYFIYVIRIRCIR